MKLVIFNTFAVLIEWQTKLIPKQNSYISRVECLMFVKDSINMYQKILIVHEQGVHQCICSLFVQLSNTAFSTVKLLNSRHLRVLRNFSVIKRCPQLRGSITKIVTFGTKHFVRYSKHVRYL